MTNMLQKSMLDEFSAEHIDLDVLSHLTHDVDFVEEICDAIAAGLEDSDEAIVRSADLAEERLTRIAKNHDLVNAVINMLAKKRGKDYAQVSKVAKQVMRSIH